MLNKPKFMSPSMNIKEWTRDVNSENLIFSCVPDGNEAIISWQIKIYTLNKNVLVYDTGEISSGDNLPFYPIDEKSHNATFSVNLKDYPTITDNLTEGFTFENSPEPYYWTIYFKGTTGAYVGSVEEVFYANSTPIVTVKYSKTKDADFETGYKSFTDSTILDDKKCYFKASYFQKESVPLKCFGWRLRDIQNSKILMDTISKNHIYGTSDNIIMVYDGFLNDSTYSIELYVETQNNDTLITAPIQFSIKFQEVYVSADFKVEPLFTEPSIMLSWEDCHVITGHPEGDYSFKDNYPMPESTSVLIPENSSIVYDYGTTSPIDIPESSYMVISTQLSDTNKRMLLSAEGVDDNGNYVSRKLMFSDNKFVYTIVSGTGVPVEKKYTIKNSPSRYVWYIIIMSPYLGDNGVDTTLTVTESVAVNQLYPKETIYPGATQYPSFGEWGQV